MDRYLLKADWHTEWTQVDKATWVEAERAAGFHNTMGQPQEPATGGFSGRGVSGRILANATDEGTKRWPDLCYVEDIEGGQGFTCSLVLHHDGRHLAAEGDSPNGRVLAEWS